LHLFISRNEKYVPAGIAQSVERLATGWTTKGSEFKFRWGQEFSLLHVVHPTSYPPYLLMRNIVSLAELGRINGKERR
jgi:hypothetical protein